jgi:List-Bact-rpt repeat protein
MPQIKQLIITFFLILICLVINLPDSGAKNTDDDPSVVLHDTVASPGILLLRIDANNFIGDNGQISAITFNIEVDTLLVEFISIQNMSLTGNWLGNYNVFQNEITITYNAPFGSGFDINGSLLDIQLEYFGGFDAELNFKANCEITNINLQTIQNVAYDNGLIEQISPLGTISMDTVINNYDELFTIPVQAQGAGYGIVNSLSLRISHDTSQVSYNGITQGILSNLVVSDSGNYIVIDWTDATSIDLTSLDTLFYLNYYFIGDTNTAVQFLPGSMVINNATIVATEFIDGHIHPLLPVTLYNNPDTSGITTGGGYYQLGDLVTISAIPNVGFDFVNWTQNEIVISDVSEYTFDKQIPFDTIYANYETINYNLSLIPSPPDGGTLLGQGTYSFGEAVTAIAVPADGYNFGYWTFGSDTVSSDSLYSFTMPANHIELIALFLREEYIISAIPNNSDYGTVEGAGNYFYGDMVSLIAIPYDGYEFIVWTEGSDIISYNSLLSFEADSDRELIANFQYISSCSPPIGLFAGSINETSTILYWVSSGNEEEWDLIWGETGFDITSGGNLIEGLTNTEYVLENLDPGMEYDFYVRAICNESTTSSWSDSHTFATWHVGVNNPKNDLFILYPIPASTSINIRCLNNQSSFTTYNVISRIGNQMDNGSFYGSGPHILNVETYPSGLYIIRLIGEGNNEAITFIKK